MLVLALEVGVNALRAPCEVSGLLTNLDYISTGEYPAGSVGCAESTGDLKKGTRHRWFILFTNTMINSGFVFGAFIPCMNTPQTSLESCVTNFCIDVIAAATKNGQYSVVWRVSLGIGVVFPLALFLLRMRLKEPEEFTRESMRRKTPYKLVFQFYWFRLACVSLIWFLYNVGCIFSQHNLQLMLENV